MFVASFADEWEVVGVEVGLEGEEVDGGVGVDGFEELHIFLADFLVLVEEGGDEAFFHEFPFLREYPCHAVDEDDVFRPAVDVAYVVKEGSVAEADEGVALVDVFPSVFVMHFDAAFDDVEVEGFFLDAGRIRDDVDFPTEGLPQDDLVVEFRSRSAVNAGESVDEYFFLFLRCRRLKVVHAGIVAVFQTTDTATKLTVEREWKSRRGC